MTFPYKYVIHTLSYISQDKANKQVSLTPAQKRRIRRKRLHAAKVSKEKKNKEPSDSVSNLVELTYSSISILNPSIDTSNKENNIKNMSSIEIPTKSREDVKAAREAKKIAKQKSKNKSAVEHDESKLKSEETKIQNVETVKNLDKPETVDSKINECLKSKDEVDRANVVLEGIQESADKSRDQIKAERAAKKAAKQAKKKGEKEESKGPDSEIPKSEDVIKKPVEITAVNKDIEVEKDLTVKDVVNTLKDIVNVAKEVQEVTAKVQSIYLEENKVIHVA